MTKKTTDTQAKRAVRTRLGTTGLLGALVAGLLSSFLAAGVAVGTLGLIFKRPEPIRRREPLLWDDGFGRI